MSFPWVGFGRGLDSPLVPICVGKHTRMGPLNKRFGDKESPVGVAGESQAVYRQKRPVCESVQV